MPAPRLLVLRLLVPILLWAGLLLAHPEGRAYCSVRTVLSGVEAEFDLPLHPPASPADVVAALLREVRADTPSGPCRAEAGPPRSKRSALEQRAAVAVRFECPPGPVTLTNRWGEGRDAQSESLCAIDGAAWVFRPGAPSVDLGTPPRPGTTFRTFLVSGARQLLRSPDHALFLVLLLVSAVRTAVPPGRRHRLRAVVAIVAAFSLGHLLTLALAGLGLIQIDPRLIDTLIALSVLVVAVENLLVEQPRWRAFNAGLFGLVHGLGLAADLGRAQIPEHAAPWALAGFGVGFELAEAALVLPLGLGLCAIAARAWYRRRVLWPVSGLAALLAALWALKRATALSVPPWLGG